MKIAHILPNWSSFDYREAFGIKRVAYDLLSNQVKKGNDVYLIAPKKSILDKGKLIEITDSLKEFGISLYDDKSFLYGTVYASAVASLAFKFDILHSHIEHVLLPFIKFIKIPVVSTIHGTGFSEQSKYIFEHYKSQFIAIGLSKAATKYNSFIDFTCSIYNGIDLSFYKPNYHGNEEMLWMGRYNPQKGTIEAIKVANLMKKKLRIGGMQENSQDNYYKKVIQEVEKSANIVINGRILHDSKSEFYAGGKLTLFPITWEEPFGLVMVESMACGTPVVAYARGSVPEVVRDGETGFIVNSSEEDKRGNFIVKKTGIEGLCEAVEKIYAMTKEEYQVMRCACRAHVEANFTVEKMVDNYEKVYQKIISQQKK